MESGQWCLIRPRHSLLSVQDGGMIMFVPLSTVLILITGAFMLGMLIAFIMVIRAMVRFKK